MKLNNADVCLQLSDAMHLTKPGTLYCATMVNKYFKKINNSLCFLLQFEQNPEKSYNVQSINYMKETSSTNNQAYIM